MKTWGLKYSLALVRLTSNYVNGQAENTVSVTDTVSLIRDAIMCIAKCARLYMYTIHDTHKGDDFQDVRPSEFPFYFLTLLCHE